MKVTYYNSTGKSMIIEIFDNYVDEETGEFNSDVIYGVTSDMMAWRIELSRCDVYEGNSGRIIAENED